MAYIRSVEKHRKATIETTFKSHDIVEFAIISTEGMEEVNRDLQGELCSVS